jgi:hypothetical protein
MLFDPARESPAVHVYRDYVTSYQVLVVELATREHVVANPNETDFEGCDTLTLNCFTCWCCSLGVCALVPPSTSRHRLEGCGTALRT